MERRIKHRDLWYRRAKRGARCFNPPQVMRVVKRCQFNGVFDGMQHRTVNGHAALELFAAMHHAMAHRVQVTAAGEPRSTLRRGDKRHQPLHRRAQGRATGPYGYVHSHRPRAG